MEPAMKFDVDVGGGDAEVLKYAEAYETHFVDPKGFKRIWASYRNASLLPNTLPHIKVACILWQLMHPRPLEVYSDRVDACQYVPAVIVERADRTSKHSLHPLMKQADKALQHFWSSCAVVTEAADPKFTAKWRALIGNETIECICASPKRLDIKEQVVE